MNPTLRQYIYIYILALEKAGNEEGIAHELIKNDPKTIKKRIKHVSKIPLKFRPGGTEIEVWRAPGRVWRRLGASYKLWTSWGPLGRVLGTSRDPLEASWACLGGILGRLRSVLGASWGLSGASWGRLQGLLSRPVGVLGCLGGLRNLIFL